LATDSAPAGDRFAVKWLLRGGLGLAAALMAAGLVVRVATGAVDAPGVPLPSLFGAGLPLGDRLMGLGALLLGLTPTLRVLTLVGLWTKERDWRFAGVAALVVVTLGVALALGAG
jgi:hypothetical protein